MKIKNIIYCLIILTKHIKIIIMVSVCLLIIINIKINYYAQLIMKIV